LLRDKTDAMDAQAIWVAAQQPHIKPVPVKSERQQTCLALHGMRRQLMKMRIMQTNALRGILAEFGIALPVGHTKLLKTIQGEIARAQQADQLSADLVISLQEQLRRIDALQGDIDQLSQRLRAMIREDRQMQAIQQIPGVGDLTASALVAAVGDFSAFKSGRQFASWVGLVPRQVGTGGKTQQLGISKRGDTYLRTLLIAGARAVIARSEKSSWINRLLERRHYNVAQPRHRDDLHDLGALSVQPHDLLAALVKLRQCLTSCAFFLHDSLITRIRKSSDFIGPYL